MEEKRWSDSHWQQSSSWFRKQPAFQPLVFMWQSASTWSRKSNGSFKILVKQFQWLEASDWSRAHLNWWMRAWWSTKLYLRSKFWQISRKLSQCVKNVARSVFVFIPREKSSIKMSVLASGTQYYQGSRDISLGTLRVCKEVFDTQWEMDIYYSIAQR